MLAFEEHGRRDGLAVVLLHGYPLDRGMWKHQAVAVAQAGHHVILPDLRGFGASPPLEVAGAAASPAAIAPTRPAPTTGPASPPSGRVPSMDGMARDVLGLMDHLRVRRAVVGGFSMGGYVALALAGLAPSRLSGLALLCARTAADGAEARAGRDAAIAAVRTQGAAAVATPMLGRLLSPGAADARPGLAAEVRAMLLRQPAEGIVQALAAMRDRPDRGAVLDRPPWPVLIVAAAGDAVIPLAEARAMADRAGTALAEVPGGHLAPMEHPHPFNEAVLAWLAKLDA